ncbi:Aliphatic amidase [Mycobacterium simulans]|uniref:nitrilase-related carbon-nitrogen hydrolase n=1 Tax=Mycobacterium simulans TaxID=627089 RepID=UPI00174DA09B|nr:nitrilase-related carbon-nitrogen hydrolase [Mycobacterium simulans]SON63877.1 Aliphatic amidase [Mycobacterium simulans]
MIEPYTVVGLVPNFWGIRSRADITNNLDHIEGLAKAAFWLANLDIPVRLIAIPEGGLQGFNDEILDVDHAEFANTCAIDIPGPETDRLGQLARKWNVFIMAQAKARHEDWPDRFFNVGFVIDPDGAIVLKHYKISALLPCERSVSPHDVFDWWIDRHGRTLQAFWPVADTAIGRLGIMMAMEGNYPENGRGLALNGAEVVYRASLPAPFTQHDFFEISNRARALENNMYIVAPNMSGYYLYPETAVPIDAEGGQSMIVDYRGAIIGRQPYSNNSTFVTGTINIEALRHHRENAQVTNWLKDIRSELAQIIYERPIYPKNLYADRIPGRHAEYKQEVIDRQVMLMQELGIWKAPSRS